MVTSFLKKHSIKKWSKIFIPIPVSKFLNEFLSLYSQIIPNGHVFVDSPSVRRWNSTWKVRQDFVDFEKRIFGNYDIDLIWKFRRGFDFNIWRNIDEFSTWIFICCFDVESTQLLYSLYRFYHSLTFFALI